MGVKDLWKLLEPAGTPVSLESLEGLILAVDVSIWLNQAVKGVRDRHGNPIDHAHLIVLFSRICKLLHYHIRPIFVFDGAAPALKIKTLAARSRRRESASQRSLRAADLQASKFLQAKILEQLTGEKSAVSAPLASRKDDMFALPDLPQSSQPNQQHETTPPADGGQYRLDVAELDLASGEFDSLPPELQHELLLERQQLERHSYSLPHTLPQLAGDFSSYQLSKLVQQSHTSKRLAEVRQVMKSQETSVVGLGGGTSSVHEVEASRIMSSESARYILVKGVDMESEPTDLESGPTDVESGPTDMESGPPDVESGPPDVESGTDGFGFTAGMELYVSDIQHSFLPIPPTPSHSEATTQSNASPNLNTPPTIVAVETKDCDVIKQQDGTSRLQSNERTRFQATTLEEERQDTVAAQQREMDKSIAIALQQDRVGGYQDEVREQQGGVHSYQDGRNDVEDEQDRMGTNQDEMKQQQDGMSSNQDEMKQQQDGMSSNQDEMKQQQDRGDSNQVNTHNAMAEVSSTWHHEEEEEEVGEFPDNSDEDHQDRGQADMSTTASSTADQDRVAVDTGRRLLAVSAAETQARLGREAFEAGLEAGRQSRAAASITSSMYREAQELLALFGLPYIVAPTEAEAQCAALEVGGVSAGSITDDSDIFLFGGQTVYRHFYTQGREIEVYRGETVQRKLGLDRGHMITLAYLLGSDYTEGVGQVGVVSAMEILRDFPGTGMETLKKFKVWHDEVNAIPALSMKETAQQRKLRQVSLEPGFPEPCVREAYLAPDVDATLCRTDFEWGKPDLDLIRSFAAAKMCWTQDKVDEMLLPVLKRINAKEQQQQQQQKRLTQFFPRAVPSSSAPDRPIKSKRVRQVVARLKHKDSEQSSPAKRAGARKARGKQRATATKKAKLEIQLSSSGSSSDE